MDQVLRSLDILTSDWGFGWSPTRITLSTIGVIPAMRRFLDETKVHLAVSLHNPIGSERALMMPVQNRYPIEEVVSVLKKYDFSGQRRVSFEYIVFRGYNDSPAHVNALSRLLSGLKCRINLIRFHAIPDAPMEGVDDDAMVRFRDALNRKEYHDNPGFARRGYSGRLRVAFDVGKKAEKRLIYREIQLF